MPTYRLADSIPANIASELSAFDAYTQQLLYQRGITDAEAAERFLAPSYDDHVHDPFLLPDIDAAVKRIQAAISANERIAIYCDYDCDGIPGGVVLHDFLTAVGHENVSLYIPHRHYEGFGFSEQAVTKLKDDGVSLIVTIDCGTSDGAAIAAAAAAGMDVVVTDHHEASNGVSPEAVAVVNPKIGDSYPFDGLCGAAVIFKVVQALIARGEYVLTPGWEKWWLDMVGIATIADMVPLVDENRVFAYYGLQVLRKSRRPGLQQLLRKAKANQRYLSEDDIGFTIGPRINAASRMDDPEDAFYLLAAKDEAEAGRRVEHLEKLNTDRKAMVATMTKEVHKRMADMTEVPEVIVLGNPEWRPSLVGLSANKLVEEYQRPVFLWGRDGNECFKGSCRAPEGMSVVKLMEAAQDLFTEWGGHHGSGGFSVKAEHIHTFGTELNEAFAASADEIAVENEVIVDAYVRLDDIPALHKALAALAPFGHSNQKPLFCFANVTPEKVDVFGKAKDHTKLVFSTGTGTLEAIAFFRLPESFAATPAVGESVTLYAHVEESYFMGRHQTRLRIVDIV